MITPGEIKKKAISRWNQGKVLRSWLGAELIFPLVLPAGKPTASQLLKDFAQVRSWKSMLESHALCHVGHGYRIEYTEINHRQFGRQRLPKFVIFDSVDDLAKFIGKHGDIKRFANILKLIRQQQPGLCRWVERYPLKTLAQASNWPRLLIILDYFKTHPCYGRYLRELDIPDVDTKFIEQHKGLIKELLDIVLPTDAIDRTVIGLSRFGFERRYGLKYDEPLIRFRFLDAELAKHYGGLDDLSLPLSQFHKLNPNCTHVFITENKINGLSFPAQPQSMVIFGLGYGISMLKQASWFAQKELFYWGDIDTHGFAILSQLRGYFPHTQSLLMDQETLQRFRPLWVSEGPDQRVTTGLTAL
ncbi:MAG: hypothetical protein DSZ28_05380, partial [Thiothrix sp.]